MIQGSNPFCTRVEMIEHAKLVREGPSEVSKYSVGLRDACVIRAKNLKYDA